MSNQQKALRQGTKGYISIYDLTFRDEAHVPSWERPNSEPQGTSELRVHIHPDKKWMMICLAEYGNKSSRETMLTLQPDMVRILADYLNKKLDALDTAGK